MHIIHHKFITPLISLIPRIIGLSGTISNVWVAYHSSIPFLVSINIALRLTNWIWSHNTLETDLLNKVLDHGNISVSFPKVLSATLFVIHSSNFEVMYKLVTSCVMWIYPVFLIKPFITVVSIRCTSIRGWMVMTNSISISSPMLHSLGSKLHAMTLIYRTLIKISFL